MRFGAHTRHSPDDALERARGFFGSDGVAITAASSGERQTDVTILSREYNSWTERFIRELH